MISGFFFSFLFFFSVPRLCSRYPNSSNKKKKLESVWKSEHWHLDFVSLFIAGEKFEKTFNYETPRGSVTCVCPSNGRGDSCRGCLRQWQQQQGGTVPARKLLLPSRQSFHILQVYQPCSSRVQLSQWFTFQVSSREIRPMGEWQVKNVLAG